MHKGVATSGGIDIILTNGKISYDINATIEGRGLKIKKVLRNIGGEWLTSDQKLLISLISSNISSWLTGSSKPYFVD
jgi:hypothetical protein